MTEQPKPAEKERDKFKFQVVYLVPILASLLFGLACAYLLAPHQTEIVPPSTPIDQATPGAPFANALYFVVLIGISATIFYILIKRRNKRIIKALIIVAMTTASMLLSIIYLLAFFAYFPTLSFLLIPLAIVITVLFDLVIFRIGRAARNIAVIFLGGGLGIFFASSIVQFAGLVSAVLILIFLAVYDVVAVYKGPVGKIAAHEQGLDSLQGLSYSFKDIQMGLGDLVFYSMLTGAMFFSFLPNVLPTIVAIVGVLAGSVITLFMLEKKGIFPGLPFPIMLGLAFGLIAGFLL